MLLNYYLKLKSQLTSATSVTNNYFRRASGVLALNAVAQGSGLRECLYRSLRAIHLIWNKISQSLLWLCALLARRLSLHPPGLQQWHICVAVGAAQIPEDPTLGCTCEPQAEFFCLQPRKSEGSNSLRLNTAISREKGLLCLPASQFTFVLIYIFFLKQVEDLPEKNRISAWKEDEHSDTHLNSAASCKE